MHLYKTAWLFCIHIVVSCIHFYKSRKCPCKQWEWNPWSLGVGHVCRSHHRWSTSFHYFIRIREVRILACLVFPNKSLVVCTLDMQLQCILCWWYSFWLHGLRKQESPTFIHRSNALPFVQGADKHLGIFDLFRRQVPFTKRLEKVVFLLKSVSG